MWNGSILGEMTTGAATIIGIVGLCVIATSNKAIKSKMNMLKTVGGQDMAWKAGLLESGCIDVEQCSKSFNNNYYFIFYLNIFWS